MKILPISFLLLSLGSLCFAQTEKQLNEVVVTASRTTNNAEGYTTNLRGMNIAKGKPAVDVLVFLPNISREQGTF